MSLGWAIVDEMAGVGIEDLVVDASEGHVSVELVGYASLDLLFYYDVFLSL